MTSATTREDDRARRQDLLRAWTAIERFGSTTLGRTARSDRRVAIDLEPGQPLPWEPGHPVHGRRPVSDRVEWRHTLHLGHFDIGAAYAAVEAEFPEADPDADEERRRPYGIAALLAVTVTSDGRPLVDTLQVSSAAWSIARTLRLGVDDPGWLDGFSDAADQVGSAFGRLMEEIAAAGPAGARQAGDGAGQGVDGALGAGEAGEEAGEPSTVAAPTDPAVVPPTPEDPAPDDPPVGIDEDGIATEPVTWEVILRLLALARKILELDDHLTIRPLARTTSWQQAIRAPHSHGDTLLNSFAVSDLERVARDLAATRGRPTAGKLLAPSALERYLDAARIADAFADADAIPGSDQAIDASEEPAPTGPSEPAARRGPDADAAHAEARIDVDADLDRVRDRLHPSRWPAGRWPADARHDLALGQQVAVNLALDPDGPTIVAVNGPPGTGKTTMLRDLIAGLVTERAHAIAQLSAPDEVFTARLEHGSDDRRVIAHRVTSTVAGRELLLACATNAAAQNVSLELPTRAAIAPEWAGRPGALADFATAALRAAAEDDARAARDAPLDEHDADRRATGGRGQAGAHGAQADAWAMVSARLGRRSYGKAFAEAIWWGAPAWADRSRQAAVSERVAVGLSSLLTEGRVEQRRAAWVAARDRFLAAEAEVERLRAERTRAADRIAPPPGLRERIVERRAEVAELAETVERLVEARAKLADTVAGTLKDRALAAARRGLARVQAQDARIATARAALDAATEALAADEAALADRARARNDAAHQPAGGDPDHDGAPAPGEAEHSSAPPTWLAADEAWETDRDARERRAPWSDEAWNRARTECFLAALDLHEATLRGAGRKAQQNLRVAFDLLSGRVAGLPADITLAAWQTLFLLVPVVSTTFASMPTLLSGLRAGALGWLLVDEAGQAEPQQAVGGLWRCRRAVIVGDPLQLDPVGTLPPSLAEAIRAHHGVDPLFIGPEASVQRLADAVMPWGGRRGEDDLWVGVPMNVHRRCEQPIFELVNAIAYGGRMVNATVPRAAHPALRVPSCWLDVPETSAAFGGGDPRGGGRGRRDGHWRPAEGARLDDLLAHLAHAGFDMREVFAVSPFRDVARHLDERARRPAHRGMTGGTIHTIQGREADVVILVLGGDPSRGGARRWAAAKPNLLNVAVSRARQRLYVIGDHEAWAPLPYFRELSGLRRVPPRGNQHASVAAAVR